MFRVRVAVTAVLSLPLAGCLVGPSYHPPAGSVLAVPPGYATPAPTGAVPDLQRWWVNFNDPQLDAIVDLALKDNLDIAQAVSRLRQARESLIQSRASLFPTVNANVGYSRNINIRGRTFGQITNAGIVNENYSLSSDVS